MTRDRRGWAVARAAAAAVLAALALAGCGGGGSDPGVVVGSERLTVWSAETAQVVPDVAGTDLDDNPVDTAKMRGRVLVLNVWGSWCAPCITEAPVLARTATDLMPAGVQFLGIDIREGGDRVAPRLFEEQYDIPYPSLFDDDGRALLELRAFVPQSPPVTLVLDAQGRLRGRVVGVIDETTLRGLVADAGGPAAGGARATSTPTSTAAP